MSLGRSLKGCVATLIFIIGTLFVVPTFGFVIPSTSPTVTGTTTTTTSPIASRRILPSHHQYQKIHQHRLEALAALSPRNAAIAYAIGHLAAGNIGTTTVAKASSTWYRQINLPKWLPANWVFAPVWTILYACMGIATSIIISLNSASTAKVGSDMISNILRVWWGHMTLNVIWPFVFFGSQRLKLGLGINLTLLASLVGVIIPTYYVINPIAAYLLLPYALWLTFATKLNQAICALNPTDKDGYNEAKLKAGIIKLQKAAADYAGL